MVRNTILILLVGALVVNCESLGKLGKKTAISTAIGCGTGLALGALADAAADKADAKKRKDPKTAVSEMFKKKKANNKGKIVGLGAGCLAGLGAGAYLDMMADDMEERLAADGITMERIKDGNGETVEIFLNMGENAIEFESDKATFKGNSKARVVRLAEAFVAYPETKINISGHVSAAVKTPENQKLSEDRARSVANELQSNGVGGSQLNSVVGMANLQPLPGTKPQDAKNRRVDIRILPR